MFGYKTCNSDFSEALKTGFEIVIFLTLFLQLRAPVVGSNSGFASIVFQNAVMGGGAEGRNLEEKMGICMGRLSKIKVWLHAKKKHEKLTLKMKP